MEKRIFIRRNLKLFFGIFCSFLFLTIALASKRNSLRWNPENSWNPNSRYGKLFNPYSLERVDGKITEIEVDRPYTRMKSGVYLKLKTLKEILLIHLGPSWYVLRQNLKLEVGDRIVVRGARIFFSGSVALAASEVRLGRRLCSLEMKREFLFGALSVLNKLIKPGEVQMNFLVGLLIFNMLVLGLNFCFLLIGGISDRTNEEFPHVILKSRDFTVEKFSLGVLTATLGLSWLAAWLYFIITGWESFLEEVLMLSWHVGLQFVVGVSLTLSGVGVFLQWKRSSALLITSTVLLVLGTVLPLIIFGPSGHGGPTFMYLFSIWTLVIGGFFALAIFILDRYLLPEKEVATKPEERSAS